MNSETVTITIKGVEHYFNGNELISPTMEAAMFLLDLDEKEREF